MYWTGQSGRTIFITIPAIPDDGKAREKEKKKRFTPIETRWAHIIDEYLHTVVVLGCQQCLSKLWI